MNYNQMTDFEINSRVALLQGYDTNVRQHFREAGLATVKTTEGMLNFCNSWADAGPIIHKHGIAIAFDEFEQEWVAFSGFMFDKAGWDMEVEPKKYHHNQNPLRAAMIVFLMVKERK